MADQTAPDQQISVRPIGTLAEARAAAELLDRIWGEQRVIGVPLMWAMASHGGQVLGAFRGRELIGAQLGVVGMSEGRPTLHSHITGVAEDAQHHGVGLLLKEAQREWCLERGIHTITWTFDPMVARNAYFNLVKLGAVAVDFHRDYYGDMNDVFNRGDRSDRLEVVWDLESQRVRGALGLAGPYDRSSNFTFTPSLVRDEDGLPVISKIEGSPAQVLIEVPEVYHSIRAQDPERARRWRDAVAEALEAAFEDGFHAVWFVRGTGYVLERA